MYGELSGSAARLLLVYRDKNMSRLKRETIMSRSGIKTTKGFYDSRKELEMGGFIKVTRSKGLPAKVELLSIGKSDQRERLTLQEEIKIEMNTIFDKYSDNINLILNYILLYNREVTGSDIHHPDGVYQPQDSPTSQTKSTGERSENYVTSISQYTTESMGDIPVYTSEHAGSISQYTSSDVPVYPNIPDQYTTEHSPKSTDIPQYTTRDVQSVWKVVFPYAPALGKVQRETLLGLCDNNLDTFRERLKYVGEQAEKKEKQLENPYGYAKAILRDHDFQPVDNTRQVEYNTHTGIEELPDPSPELLAEADILKERFEQMKIERGWQE